MKKILSFVKLDFMTIRPYLTIKNLIVILAVATVLAVAGKSVITPMSMVIAFVTIYISYPFAVGEQNGIDPLYITLGLDRDTVVTGRYLWALAMNGAGLILAVVISFGLSLVLDIPIVWSETALIMLTIFLLFSLIQGMQLPIYFKLGYTRAKSFAYLPFIMVSIIVIVVINLGKRIPVDKINRVLLNLERNPGLTIIVGLLIWAGAMALSYILSKRWYAKREF